MGGFDYHGVHIELSGEGFLANQTAPMLRAICRATGMALKQVCELFPSGPPRRVRASWRDWRSPMAAYGALVPGRRRLR